MSAARIATEMPFAGRLVLATEMFQTPAVIVRPTPDPVLGWMREATVGVPLQSPPRVVVMMKAVATPWLSTVT